MTLLARLRDPRHVDQAVQRRRRPRQRDAARAHRDGHDHAPAALAGLLQRDRAGARVGDRRLGEVPRRPQRRLARRSSSTRSSSTRPPGRSSSASGRAQGSPLTFPTQTRNRQLLDDVTRALDKPARPSRSSATTPTTPPIPPRPTLVLPHAAERDRPRARRQDRGRLQDPAARAARPTSAGVVDAPERDLRPRRGSQRPSTHSHMRLIPRIRTRFLAAEHGFSMIIVMGVMAASVAVRRRRVRGGQRRPAADPRLAGPQAGLRGGRGRDQLLPVPPQPGPGLLDALHERAGAERHREPAGQPDAGTAPAPTRAAGARSPGTPTQYTLELLPATGYPTCVENNLDAR